MIEMLELPVTSTPIRESYARVAKGSKRKRYDPADESDRPQWASRK